MRIEPCHQNLLLLGVNYVYTCMYRYSCRVVVFFNFRLWFISSLYKKSMFLKLDADYKFRQGYSINMQSFSWISLCSLLIFAVANSDLAQDSNKLRETEKEESILRNVLRALIERNHVRQQKVEFNDLHLLVAVQFVGKIMICSSDLLIEKLYFTSVFKCLLFEIKLPIQLIRLNDTYTST